MSSFLSRPRFRCISPAEFSTFLYPSLPVFKSLVLTTVDKQKGEKRGRNYENESEISSILHHRILHRSSANNGEAGESHV